MDDWAEIHMVTRKPPNGQDLLLRTFLRLSLAAFKKPTNLLNKRISCLEIFRLVLVFVSFVFIDRHYLASEPVDRGDIYYDDPIPSMGLKIKNPEFTEVINEFDKLRMRYDVVEEEEQVVAWFLGVLKPEIADIASLL
nr:reverse transcriptase domain-containing protein [Tanacetum cinerariifolium]